MNEQFYIENNYLMFNLNSKKIFIEYYDIISKYNKINFKSPIKEIKHNSKVFKTIFENLKSNGAIIDLLKFNHLTFGYNYNQQIDVSSNIYLLHLDFNTLFNQELNLSKNINLTYLKMGCAFNKEIDLSNNINLTYLTFGDSFNKEID